MGDDERARLTPYMEQVHVEPRQTLSAAGEPIEHVYFPVDAVTSTLMLLPEGESVEVGLMGAEGVVGLALLYGDQIASTTVIVQIGGAAVRIRSEDLVREVVERGTPFHRLLLRYANLFLAMVAQVAGCNASHSVEQRLARWLLLVHDRVGRDTFALTHEFAALMLGVRRASVTQVANTLRTAGAIEYRSGQVTIVERAALEHASCGCYEVIRDLSESIFDHARRQRTPADF
ncbi:MAG TPA: Crp/Fnr family transcriptional regulator [Candidatus Elarobacter sp.]|nr:Crp/Fnr family transcriptional regulator [Candidatus Elarobacter sp.]